MGVPTVIRDGISGDLIASCYEVAANPAHWQTLLCQIRDLVGADSSLLRLYDASGRAVDISLTYGFDDAYNRLYQECFVEVDPLRDLALTLTPGRLYNVEDLVSYRTFTRSAFYAEYMRPQDKHHVIGGPLLREDGAFALFGVQRGRRDRPFTAGDVERLNALAPHLQQALRLYRRFGELRAQLRSLTSLIDRLPVAAIFLSGAGAVLAANAAGEELIAERRMLIRRGPDRTLHAAHPETDRALQRLIALASGREPRSRDAPPGGILRLRGPCSRSVPVSALVAPWSHMPVTQDVPTDDPIAVALFLGSIHEETSLPVETTAHCLGLSRSEARLAVKLVETGSLEAAAEAAGLTRETARSYLKAIYQKTGTHRQVELVRLLLRTPAGAFHWDNRERWTSATACW